ncbi:MAG: site-2 protease family protein [Clostridia bacterium]|jgi:Zn-dependent protease|nr:site-2 protease family protein [Clostridia bacterium]
MLLTLLYEGFSRNALISVLLSLPVIVLSLCLHETAHGWVAYKLGDPTARNLGRLTLNPLKHLDPMGFLFMLLFGIGWAKPVPINTRNFKNPRVGMALSGIAGPISNLLLGLLGMILSVVTMVICYLAGIDPDTNVWITVLLLFLDVLAFMNVALAVFNLIPVPPFDGSRFAYVFLPTKWYFKVMQYERFTGIAIMIIIFILSRIGLNPISIVVYFILDNTMDLLVLIANAFLNLIL